MANTRRLDRHRRFADMIENGFLELFFDAWFEYVETRLSESVEPAQIEQDLLVQIDRLGPVAIAWVLLPTRRMFQDDLTLIGAEYEGELVAEAPEGADPRQYRLTNGVGLYGEPDNDSDGFLRRHEPRVQGECERPRSRRAPA